jgi:hypothetical protein
MKITCLGAAREVTGPAICWKQQTIDELQHHVLAGCRLKQSFTLPKTTTLKPAEGLAASDDHRAFRCIDRRHLAAKGSIAAGRSSAKAAASRENFAMG